MIKRISSLLYFSYSRKKRKFLLIILDALLISISIVTAFWFINVDNFFENFKKYELAEFIILNLSVSLPIYFFSGQYKGITRFIGSTLLYRCTIRNFLIITILFFITHLFVLYKFSLKLWILIFVFQTLFTTSIRFLFRDLLSKERIINFKKNTSNILIYGAGSAGTTLSSYIKKDNRYKLSGYIDDNPNLWNLEINGIEIYSSKKLEKLIKEKDIKKIFFAIPSLDIDESKLILKKLQKHKIEVLKVPNFKQITEGGERLNNLRPISVEDLLMRNQVDPNNKLLGKSIFNKNVFVSGAGGSIGTELCRQIMELKPKKLILFEQNEPSLYLINEELKENLVNNSSNVDLVPILGNACDKNLVKRVFKENNINIIFHAAAHKHVPLVEINPLEGLKNNIISTLNLSKLALELNIEKFTLISSDKAVRPTSIMGASKRVSELIIQKLNYDQINRREKGINLGTIFSMVRFGNVLNSSGSVIPLFQNQISKGGPITITHPEITRYFMTIKEAVELVLQTSSMSKGGEIFLLDMGESVKILELAKQLISLSGYDLKNKTDEDGIEIVFTGLRPGEKLYEELLIDSSAEKTEHTLIYKSKERVNKNNNLLNDIDDLLVSIENQKDHEVFEKLSIIVNDWNGKKDNKSSF